MAKSAFMDSPELSKFLDKISGLDQPGGNPRTKAIMRRVIGHLFATIQEFDVTPGEVFAVVDWLNEAGRNGEVGLIAPGLGLERLLDILMDEADQQRGENDGTPRAIEGPLYVAGAPESEGTARLDDGSQTAPPLFMSGQVKDPSGKPIVGAVVDVWHADTKGGYSFFDSTQAAYNLRRRIKVDAEGRYSFRSILPVGYGVPPGGATEKMLNQLGRHGQRPAHIHFFVSAPRHRHLTTQINIAGDPLLHDDFAYATRDELIPALEKRDDPGALRARGVDEPFYEIGFDFVLPPCEPGQEQGPPERGRFVAA